MSFSVRFAVSLDALAADVRLEIHRSMRQIADAVSTVPPASPFWSSMNDSTVWIDVQGFRVVYRVDPKEQVVLVIEVEKLRP